MALPRRVRMLLVLGRIVTLPGLRTGLSLLAAGLATTLAVQSQRWTMRATGSARSEAVDPVIVDVLETELQWQIRGANPWAPVLHSRVQFSQQRSAVVPGVVYHMASYLLPGGAPSVPYVAVVGARPDRLAAMRGTPLSWALLTEGWHPRDPAEATSACEEFVSVTAPGRQVRVRFRADAASRALLLPGERAQVEPRVHGAAAVTAPRPDRPVWHVMLWFYVVGPARSLRQYECTLPADHTPRREGAQFVERDSVPLQPQLVL